MPYTTVVAGQVITASWANANIRDQVVTPHASVAARDSAVTSPVTGMVACTIDTMQMWLRKSGAWRSLRAAPDQYKVHLKQTSGTSCPASTFTAVTWDTEDADPSLWHSVASQTSRITPLVAGTLLIAYTVACGATGSWTTSCIRKNGSTAIEYGESQNPNPVGTQWGNNGLARVDVNGSTDYVELYHAQGTGGALTTDVNRTFLTAWMESWT